jgi:hypothetical protein
VTTRRTFAESVARQRGRGEDQSSTLHEYGYLTDPATRQLHFGTASSPTSFFWSLFRVILKPGLSFSGSTLE